MAEPRLSVQISEETRKDLDALVAKTGLNEQEALREAVSLLRKEQERPSAYDIAHSLGLIGRATHLPTDLSTNPAHMEGFGRD